MPTRRITGAELLARLEADPAWPARREAERVEQAMLARAEAPLVAALADAGISVRSVWDLVNGVTPVAAIDVLVAHLPRDYPDPIRDGIARALATPMAESAWEVVKEMLYAERGVAAEQGLAVALAGMTEVHTLDRLLALARDTTLGEKRILLLLGFETLGATAALIELSADPQLQPQCEACLLALRQRL